MPELPEVETLRRGLAARITGMRMAAAEVLDRKIFDGPGDAIRQDVVDHQISRVTRRGKGLRCQACGTPIIRSTIAGRATNYCPHCQQR